MHPANELHAHAPGQCALVQAVAGDIETLFKGVAETVHAVEISRSVEWKLNWLLGVSGTGLALGVAAFVWLFTQQQHALADSVDAAKREARNTAVEMIPSRCDSRATEIAREAIRLDREDRAREGLIVLAQAPHK